MTHHPARIASTTGARAVAVVLALTIDAPLACTATLASSASVGATALTACDRGAPRRSLAGRYRSTWGVVQVAGAGDDVAIAYPRGSMRCHAQGPALACAWRSGEAVGKARLERRADGTLVGSFGHGERDDEAPWAMAPQD